MPNLTNKTQIISSTANEALQKRIQHKIDFLTKPLGALGEIEKLALQVGLIQKSISPSINKKIHLIFASDHKICEEGVSVFPSEVTQQMVMNMAKGGAAISVFTNMQNIPCKIYDVGVLGNLPNHPDVHLKKVKTGTDNFLKGLAMTEMEAKKAMEVGIKAVQEDYSDFDMYSFGEMGIGNTSPSTAILALYSNLSISEICGRGTGLNDDQLRTKIEALTKAIEFHKPDKKKPLEVLTKIGGLEIAALTGAILGAAEKKKVIVIDGIITNAAFILAKQFQNHVEDYCIFAHKSQDQAVNGFLKFSGLYPLLNLGLKLGEGTGAVLAIPLIEAACSMINRMASFESAAVSEIKGAC